MSASAVASRRVEWLLLPLAVLLGAIVAVSPDVGFMAVGLALGVVGLSASPSVWVAAALVFALAARIFVALGVLPGAAVFVDIPLAWGALAAALLRAAMASGGVRRSPAATTSLRFLGALTLAVLVSWIFNPSEVARPFLFLALIGQPFAILTALLMVPPTVRMEKALRASLVTLLAIQVPMTLTQFAQHGWSDEVRGTLLGAGAGAHVISGVAVIGALWILFDQRFQRWLKLALVPALLFVPFAADAKQVLFAVPLALLLVGGRRASGGRAGSFIRRAAVAAVLIFATLVLYPASQTALNILDQAQNGRSGKAEVASYLWSKISEEPSSIAFGLGPAETVSRTAYMTTDLLLEDNSPLRAFGLHPSSIAAEAQTRAEGASGGDTSFNSALSSGQGVFGDLGVFGLATYIGFFVWQLLMLKRCGRDGAGPRIGIVMLLMLGLVFDWWEQPPFTVFLAVIVGLAMRTSQRPGQAAPSVLRQESV